MFRKLAFAFSVLTSFAAAAQTIERSSVKVGDKFRYDVFDNLPKDVTSVEGDRININWTQKMLVSGDTEDLESGAGVSEYTTETSI